MNPTAQLLEPDIRELIASGRYGELRSALGVLDPADIADLLGELEPADAAVAFRFLHRDLAGEAFADLEHDQQEALIEEIGAEGALRVVEAMDPDDRADLLDELPGPVARRIIELLSPRNRRVTQAILGYHEDSIGRLITPEYVRVRPEWTIQEAIDHIREHGRDAETIHWVYVIDDQGRLIDDIHIRTILLADPSQTIESVMDDRFVALDASEDREQAVHLMAHYDRTVLPVVDSDGVLVGIVTSDDIADVAEEEVTEDIHKLGGMEALDQPYMQTGLLEMIRKRAPWLCVLFAGELVTIFVLSQFEATLQTVVVLTVLIPLIIACGGNAGTQAASLVIRALALHEIEPDEWWVLVRRELAMGLALGVILGLLAACTVLGLHKFGPTHSEYPLLLSATIAVAVTAVVFWGTMLGTLLPLVLDRLGFDPATSSSPLVATLMDASGMIIYLSIAVVMLHGTLL